MYTSFVAAFSVVRLKGIFFFIVVVVVVWIGLQQLRARTVVFCQFSTLLLEEVFFLYNNFRNVYNNHSLSLEVNAQDI